MKKLIQILYTILNFKDVNLAAIRVVTITTCLLFGGFSAIQATHVIGGYITYECLGDDEYMIELTVKRDCEFGAGNAPFDDPANIAIFDSRGRLMTTLARNGIMTANFMGDDTISNKINSNCFEIPESVCVHRSVYRERVRLPFNPEGYIIAYQRCCRNETLRNIVEPLESGSTMTVHITPDALTSCNSGPRFVNDPSVFICSGKPLFFDSRATDTDGDSLVYRLDTPSLGASKDRPRPVPPTNPPYDPVVFSQGYSLEDLMGGTPLEINPVTGMVTATPRFLGQYLIGIAIDEYRDGVLLSTVRRDFQYNVVSCDEGDNVEFTAEQPNCNVETVNFSFPDFPQVVSYIWDLDLSSESPDDISTEQNPRFTYMEPGEYTVQVVAKLEDGICEYTGIQTIQVIDNRLNGDFLDLEIIDCNENSITYGIEDNTDLELARDWESTISTDFVDSLKSQIIEVQAGESVTVSLNLLSNLGCSINDSIQLIGDLNSILDFTASIGSCQEDQVVVNLSALDVPYFSSQYTISGEGMDDIVLNGPNQQITIPTSVSEIIILRTISNGNCIRQEIKSLQLNPDNLVEIYANLLGCDNSDDSTQLIEFLSEINTEESGVNAVTYMWSIINNNGTLNFNTPNINLAIDQVRNSQIFLTVGFDNGCEVTKTLLEEELPDLDGITAIAIDGIDCMGTTASIRLSNSSQSIGDSIEILEKNWTILSGSSSGPGDLDLDRCANSSLISVNGQTQFINSNQQIVCTDFIVRNFTSIGGFQFGIQWTPRLLEISSINSDLDNFETSIPDPNRSELRVTWFDEQIGDGLTLQDGSTLFTICFNQNIPQGGMAMTNLVSLENFDIEFLNNDLELIDPCVQQAYFINGDSTNAQMMFSGNAIEVNGIGQSPVIVQLDLSLDNGCVLTQIDTIDLDFIDLDFNPNLINDTLFICSGSPENILVNPNPNYTYSWTPTNGLIIAEPGREGEALVDPAQSTTYTLTVSNGACQEDFEFYAVPNNEIELTINGEPLTCNGKAQLSVSGGFPNYEWSLDPNFGEIIGREALLTFDFTGNSATFYVRSVLNSGQCYSPISEFEVTNSGADVDIALDGLACIGDTLYITVSSPSMINFDIEWVENPAIVSPLDQNQIAVLPMSSAPIVLDFTLVNEDGCTYDSQIANESVSIQPMPKQTLGDVVVHLNCLSYEACFQTNLADGEGLWDFDINSTDDANSTEGTACYVYPGPGTYTASVSSLDENSCGFETQTFTVEIPEVLFMDVVEAADSTDIVPYCDDQEFIDLTLNTNVPTDQIYWYSTSNADPIAVGLSLRIRAMEYDSIYAGYLTADCEVQSQIVTFEIVGFDFAFDPSDGNICGGQEQMISLVGSNPENFTYEWAPSALILDGQGTPGVTVNQSEPFELSVRVTDNIKGCSKDYSQGFNVAVSPEISIQSTEGDTIFQGESTDLSVIVPNGSNVLWSTGETTSTITVDPSESTLYSVQVTNDVGCVVEAEFELTVIMAMCAEGYVFLPNAFSPNGDGRNDVLFVRSKFIKEMSLDIYDRWGALVFNTNDQDIGWNGQFRNTGEMLAPDSYAYILRVVCVNDEVFMDRGNVSIIR